MTENDKPKDKQNERPASVPEDYTRMLIQTSDGPLLIWGRAVETVLPDGSKKLTIEGFVPDE